MQEIISCPACQRKLQVPESLLGQDVQCPTCGATFVAARADEGPPVARPAAPAPARWEPEPEPRRRCRPDYDEYDDYDDRGPQRRRRRDPYLTPHRGSAVLTLGILALAVCGPVCGPIAWVMGHNDLNEMRAGRMDPQGEGMTNAGRICGMIGTILSAVGLALWVFFVLMAAVSVQRW